MFSERDEILTVADVSEILYICHNRVYELLNTGSLQGFRIGSRSWRIPRKSLEKYILQSCRHATAHDD